uniref:Uncharacterized protein LOC116951124 isoform X2 n=1 Tax=Petromyzon marinus TaxID=7757 RepID=A0AAJ7TYR5_PETMA|nr:uncharacterized protein LOC116951124 isoform X2 [Petromyzon marinus]
MKEEAERDDRYQGRQKKRRRNGWAARASPGRAQRDAVRATRRRRLLAAIVATSSPRPPRTASAKSQQKRRAAVGTRPTNTRPEKAPSTRSANVGHHGEQHSAQPPNASESHGKLHSAGGTAVERSQEHIMAGGSHRPIIISIPPRYVKRLPLRGKVNRGCQIEKHAPATTIMWSFTTGPGLW